VEIDGIDQHSRCWRQRPDSWQTLLGDIPERENRDVELAGPDGSLEILVKGSMRVHAALLEQIHVALAAVCLAGGEAHRPAGLIQELEQVEQAARPTLAVVLRQKRSTHQCASSGLSHHFASLSQA
jgi:hypothetical protein